MGHYHAFNNSNYFNSFFLIWGGIEWITSGGNKEKLAGAQKKVIFAGIGLIISLGAFMIINIVGGFFGVSFF